MKWDNYYREVDASKFSSLDDINAEEDSIQQIVDALEQAITNESIHQDGTNPELLNSKPIYIFLLSFLENYRIQEKIREAILKDKQSAFVQRANLKS